MITQILKPYNDLCTAYFAVLGTKSQEHTSVSGKSVFAFSV